jgi:hypothetical protein
MRQVATWNSERRRRALVSNWDCMRLESAMRTPIVVEVALDDRFILYISQKIKRNDVAIVGRRGTVHKETSHKI